jgi:hypothetical protein
MSNFGFFFCIVEGEEEVTVELGEEEDVGRRENQERKIRGGVVGPAPLVSCNERQWLSFFWI